MTSEYPQLFEVTKSSTPAQKPPVSPSEKSCDEKCKEIFGNAKNMEITEISGTHPKCRCEADWKDIYGKVIKTVKVVGNVKTTYIFDPKRDYRLSRTEVTTISEEGEGIIDRPIEFSANDRDKNRCSPVEYAYQHKTTKGGILILCKCKPGYKGAEGGCMFDKPKNTKLSNEELKKLELTLRKLDTNQQNTIRVMKDGKLVKLGVLRRADQSLVYTLDGKTWDSELKNLLNPDNWYKAGRAIGNFFDAINIFKRSQASYGDNDKQMRYEAVDDALKVYKKSIQKPKHFNQYVYDYYKSAESKHEAIETLYQAGILQGGAELATGALKGWAIQFPAKVVEESMNTAQTQVLADGFSVYARGRGEGISSQKVMKDDKVQQRIGNLRGQPAFIGPMGEVILGQLYEEAYQRYLLRKELYAE